MADDERLLGALEAILMVVDEPVPADVLALSLGFPPESVEDALRLLQSDYDGGGGARPRGFELRKVGGGWRIYTRQRWADDVAKFVVGTESSQLSQAALETLAIVAYRQPVTRHQVAQIRGVNVDSVMRTLQTRDLIADVGSTATGAHLYGTTSHFLACMGFETLEELIPLAPFLPSAQEVAAATLEVEVDE